MIVSIQWLKQYVALPDSVDELTDRLTLSGLNLEGVEQVGDDTAVDLEVTSNRPDCLGHIGVAREIAVLFAGELATPPLETPAASETGVGPVSVTVECPDLCPRYTARVIRGVKVGPSPAWLADRLRTLGIAVINNVVDVTNYVMMECGQPLHAFDLQQLAGGQIIVRAARPGEKFLAINHREYELDAGTCVIADQQRAVALGGVMGGADTEVSETTVDVLIEAADFAPLSVRTTARRLNLHSPSSYRFERGVDPDTIDWASRRCCDLLLQLAGGKLQQGAADVAEPREPRSEIKLRFDQVPRILGIEVADQEVRQILTSLGCQETHACDHCVKVVPPAFRADLTREIDLIEEVARIHGYDQIPEDAGVKMAASIRARDDQMLERVRQVLVAAGYCEAMTLSAVEPSEVEWFRPWSDAEPLRTSTPVLRRADCLRQSLVPSLLVARRYNEKVSNPTVELFEIAKAYLPATSAAPNSSLPQERRLATLTSGGDYLAVKGVVEGILQTLGIDDRCRVAPSQLAALDSQRSAAILLGDRAIAHLGELSQAGMACSGLRNAAAVAEVDLEALFEVARVAPDVRPLSPYPPVARDLNLVVDESVCWADVAAIVEQTGGGLLETLAYQETWRDPERLGVGKKSLLFSIQLRSDQETLTNEEADAVRDRIVAALAEQVGGELRA